jgi:hypothetical protein
MDLREIIWVWGLWSGFSWLRLEADGGIFEYGDEPSFSGDTDLVNHLDSRHAHLIYNFFDLFLVEESSRRGRRQKILIFLCRYRLRKLSVP